jgi:hypothetical protein
MNLLLTGSVNARDFCTSAQSIIQVIGWVVTIFRIVVPLLIIVLGIFSLGKAAISSKPEDIKKNIGGLIWRFVGGIAIFFLPSIIMTVFGFFTQWTTIQNEMQFKVCKDCLLAPWSCSVNDTDATY